MCDNYVVTFFAHMFCQHVVFKRISCQAPRPYASTGGCKPGRASTDRISKYVNVTRDICCWTSSSACAVGDRNSKITRTAVPPAWRMTPCPGQCQRSHWTPLHGTTETSVSHDTRHHIIGLNRRSMYMGLWATFLNFTYVIAIKAS